MDLVRPSRKWSDRDHGCDGSECPAYQYGGSASYHSPRARNASQNARFEAWSSSDSSMAGTTSTSIVGVRCWTRPTSSSTGAASGRSSALRNETVSLAHRHDDLGLDDRQLALEPARGGLGVGGIPRLQAVRAVQEARVDPEPLHRLEHRLAGTAEERDALGELGRSRRVLQQEDVGERVPRAEDATRQLVAELVDLADRARQVVLVDLILRQGSLIFARTGGSPTRGAGSPVRAAAPT